MSVDGTDPMDTPAAEAVRREITRIRIRYDELKAELDAIAPALRAHERALALLTGEPTPQKPKGPRVRGVAGVKAGAKGISPQRLEELRRRIVAYTADNEEFRQIDIRAIGPFEDGGPINSSITATAFEQLRQQNFLRLARSAGPNKYYRLTRETLNAQAEAR